MKPNKSNFYQFLSSKISSIRKKANEKEDNNSSPDNISPTTITQFNEQKSIISQRRSVRKYTPYKPPHKTIYDIISTAYFAPRAGNITTARTILVEDKQKIATIANLCYQQSWISQAPCVLVITSDMSDIYKLYPDIAYRFATQNTTSYIQNALLLIHAAGLSSCWVESFQEEVLKDFLNIPQNQEIHAVLPIGFAKEIPKPPGNCDILMMLSYDTYGNKTRKHQ